jgi:hypothetical protein
MNAIDRFNALPAERREAILARAEELIRAERAGRSAPETNRKAAPTAACVVIGIALGVLLLIYVVVFS